MEKVKHVLLGNLGREVIRFARFVAPETAAEFQRRSLHDVFVALPPETPVGRLGGTSRGRGKVDRGTSPHPGKMRGSWLPSVGTAQFANLPDRPFYPIPGANVVDAVLPRIHPGVEAQVTNDATTDGSDQSYAPIIFGGRRRGARGMVGSTQAPQGLAPVVRTALQRSEEFFRAAFRRGLDLF